jgi:hypothetical protein
LWLVVLDVVGAGVTGQLQPCPRRWLLLLLLLLLIMMRLVPPPTLLLLLPLVTVPAGGCSG